ncbi:MAG: DNA polymerase IV [Anaerostipes sp.]|nr:DNA polymerase IV [Anaerostipes sp.]
MTERVIFHIDVNSAFLSWEAVYGMKERGDIVDLREVPSIIGGDEATRHGIVLAASMPAKRLGIRTAETIREALVKCPNLIIKPPMRPLYEKYSKAFVKEALEYSNVYEQFSIDEIFLDMTGKIELGKTPVETAYRLKDQIQNKLGFTVNIGISSNKLLAKMASDFEKPNRVHTLFLDEIREKMWPLKVGDLFSVGKSTGKKLEVLGIHTIGDLAQMDLKLLQSHIGKKHGRRIHQFANGIDDSKVESRGDINKGYGHSITLSRDISNENEAGVVLLSLVEKVTARLRRDQVKGDCVVVELRDKDFHRYTHQRKLDVPTDITDEIMKTARELFLECYKGTPVRLLGVRVTGISKEEYSQMGLFDNEKKEKLRKLDASLDRIRQRYGNDSIQRGSIFLQSGKEE